MITRSGLRHGQIVSASLVSLAHGANDAQETMGVITLTLITAGTLPSDAGLAIALGTFLGGWRIIRTVGPRLTDIEPQQGFAAESSAALVILASSHLGYPLSTTQVTSGAVIVAVAAIAVAAAIYLISRRDAVRADNVDEPIEPRTRSH